MKRARESDFKSTNSLLHKLRRIETFGPGPFPGHRFLANPSTIPAYRVHIDDVIDAESKIKSKMKLILNFSHRPNVLLE